MEGGAESCNERKPIAAVGELSGGSSGENDVRKLGSGDCAEKGLPQKEAAGAVASSPSTMAVSGSNVSSPSQMTIFFNGKVCVFDGIPAEKVHEIIRIAATAAAAATNNSDAVKNIVSATECPAALASAPVLTRSPSLQSTTAALPSPVAQGFPLHRPTLCKLQAELPIARKHSLQRFFEKRRDRLVSKNPYSRAEDKKNEVEDKKASPSAATSPDAAGSFENSHLPQVLQPKTEPHMA